MKEICSWKKLYKQDLGSIIVEMREFLEIPAVILLTGTVGAGKTTFAKAFIEKNYQNGTPPSLGGGGGYNLIHETPHIVHGDFYRLKEPAEVIHLELPCYLESKDFFLVEWGRNFLPQLVREVPEFFHYYELAFSFTTADKGQGARRNMALYDIQEDI